MAGLWASPNKTAFCSLVWRSLGSKAQLPAGPVMSQWHVRKGTSVQLSVAEHTWTSQSLSLCVCGCVFLKDLMRAYAVIWHQSNHPTTVKLLLGVSSKRYSLLDWQLQVHFAQEIFWCASLKTLLKLCGAKNRVVIQGWDSLHLNAYMWFEI